MGFRRLLNRAAKLEPTPAELAETPTPCAPFAQLPARAPAASLSLVETEKKVEPLPEPVREISAADAKKAGARTRSGYVWRSQASRERRSEAMDFGNTTF